MAEKTLFIPVSSRSHFIFSRKAGTIITTSLISKYKNRKRRKVTLDSNVLISYVISKKDNTINKKVVIKSVTDDRLMLSDVIFEECLRHADGKKARATREEIASKLLEISPEIIQISPVPPTEDLLMRYKIRDLSDLKILYSVEMTESVILVTMDDDFSDVTDLKAKIMRPGDYLFEKNGRERKKQRK